MKLFSILLMVVLFYNNTVAQTKSRIEVGPRLGAGVRMISGNQRGDIGFGYQAGVSSSIQIHNTWYLMPGLAFSRKGYYHYEYDLLFGEEDVSNQRLSYIDAYIPVAIQLSHLFYLQAGLQCGILLSAKYTSSNSGFYSGSNLDLDYDMKPLMNEFDYGGLAGLGFKLNNGLCFDAMVNFGLKDIYKQVDSHPQYFEDQPMVGKNLLITAGMYYLIGHKRK